MVNKTKKSAIEKTAAIAPEQVGRDASTAILIVSLTINLFVLVGWIALLVTSSSDAEVTAFLFAR